MNFDQRHQEQLKEFKDRIDELKGMQLSYLNIKEFKNKNMSIKQGIEANIQEIETSIQVIKEKIEENIRRAKAGGMEDDRDPYQKALALAQEVIDRLEKDLQWRNLISEQQDDKEIPSLYSLAMSINESQDELAKFRARAELENTQATRESNVLEKMLQMQQMMMQGKSNNGINEEKIKEIVEKMIQTQKKTPVFGDLSEEKEKKSKK